MFLADFHEHDGGAVWPFLVLVAVICGIALVTIGWRKAKGGASGEPDVGEKEEPSPPATHGEEGISHEHAADVLVMLRQKGVAMTQAEVCQNAGLKEEEVAVLLAALEQGGLITRTWDRTASTYTVYAIPKDRQSSR